MLSSQLSAHVNTLGWVLIHSLWQFAAICLLAAAFLRLTSSCRATTRYAGLLAAMVGFVAAPWITWSMTMPTTIESSRTLLAETAVTTTRDDAAFSKTGEQNDDTAIVTADTMVAENLSGGASDKIVDATPDETANFVSRTAAFVQPWIETIVALWLIGAFVFSFRPLLGFYTVGRLRSRGVSAVPEHVRQLFERTARRLNLHRSVDILESSVVHCPIALGHLRPVVLLPASLISGLPISQLEAILAHELAHVRRHDYLVNLAQTLIESVFFYHPGVWWLSARVRDERENCCDDVAVALLDDRVTYGRALLALSQWRKPTSALAIGAGGGSLRSRVRRLSSRSPSTPPRSLLASALPSVAILTLIVSFSISWGVAMTQENDGSSDTTKTEGFGPESNGLRLKLIAVSTETDDDDPGKAIKVGEFADSESLAFTAELKNVSDKPIVLVGVRYGDNYATAKGRLNTARMGPHLFEFLITDRIGKPIARAQRRFSDPFMSIGGATTHELKPDESLTVLLRPGKFISPMQYDLDGGHYQARLKYTGPSDDTRAMINRGTKKDKPHVHAWPHTVMSNQIEFAVSGDSDPSESEALNWGPETDGLRAALEISVPKYVEGDPAQVPGIPLKTPSTVSFHVMNVSDKRITFTSEAGRQGDSVHVIDASGQKIKVSSPWYSGWPTDVDWILEPGDVAKLWVLSPTVSSIDQPGMYSVHYTIRFNSRQMKDDEGNITFPKPGDYKSDLKTGETLLFLRERTPEDDERAKPPRFIGHLKFSDVDGRPIESGTFTFKGEVKRADREDQPVRPGPIEIPECTTKPATVFVRAPGFEEAVFHNAEFKPGKVKNFELKRADESSFRIVTDQGEPIAGATVRFFNKTSAKASSGPFPVKGIEGDVWAKSGADGRVMLRSLQKVNPIYENLGDALYYFYIESSSADLAPRFLGPVKAGQNLGDVPLRPYIDVEGEIHGTKEQLDRFSAEWDQPFELVSENPDATWLYANSKRLRTTRDGDKLKFQLRGLHHGKLRIISNFGPRPHSVSHTYGRRDVKGDDQLFEFDLDQSTVRLAIALKKAPGTAERDSAADKPASSDAASNKPKTQKLEPFECQLVDAVTNKPLQGKATVQFRFRRKGDPAKAETIDNVVWSRAGSKFNFFVPDRSLQHPDRDELIVHWGVSHPNYQARSETVSLKEILADKPKSSRDSIRRIRLRPNAAEIKRRLEMPIRYEAEEVSVFQVISDLETKSGVPVTIDLKRLRALDITPRIEISVHAENTPILKLFERALAIAGTTCQQTDKGIFIPASKAEIMVDYDLPGAEEKTNIYVQDIDGGKDIGTVEQALSKWSPLENGNNLRLPDLNPGRYQVARMKTVDVAQAGQGRMSQQLFVDRHQFELKAGEFKRIRFARAAAKPVTGKVLGLKETGLDRALVRVHADSDSDTPLDELNVNLFDATSCIADGTFTTEPLSPGNYRVVVKAFEPLTQEQMLRTGIPTARYVGEAKLTIPVDGALPTLEIALEDTRDGK